MSDAPATVGELLELRRATPDEEFLIGRHLLGKLKIHESERKVVSRLTQISSLMLTYISR
jgi:hypothetical protein